LTLYTTLVVHLAFDRIRLHFKGRKHEVVCTGQIKARVHQARASHSTIRHAPSEERLADAAI
jgi:hypothetical protein